MRSYLRKTTITIATMILGGFLSSFQSIDYSKEWKNVESEAQRNPNTALSKINSIKKEAKAEENLPQYLKCLLMKNNISVTYTDTQGDTLLKELQDFGKQTEDKVAKALCLYLESKYYEAKFKNDIWTISRRTNLYGEIPTNMDEWTANIYMQKIHDLRLLALKEEKLRSTKSSLYQPIFSKDWEESKARPTLFDMLAYECIENAEITSHICLDDNEVKSIAADLVAAHKNDDDKTAYVEARINELKISCRNDINGRVSIDNALYEKELAKLIDETDNYPASIIARIEYASSLKENHDIWSDKSDVTPQQILKVCQNGLDKYGNHKKAYYLSSIAKSLKYRYATIDVKNPTVRQGEEIELALKYANIESIKVYLSQYDATPEQWIKEDHKKLKCKLIGEYEFKLELTNYCVRRDTVLKIPALKYGAYRINIFEKEYKGYEKLSDDFIVTDMSAIYSVNGDKQLIFMLDNKNGNPLKDVEVASYTNRYETLKESNKTNENGLASFVMPKSQNYWGNNNLHCIFKNGNDRYLYRSMWHNQNDQNFSDNQTSKEVKVFTDRAIYRPGQTVHFKCIAYKISKEATNVLENATINLFLMDANAQKVGKAQLKTNAFGSASGSFIIPTNALAGRYRITGDANLFITVEEYKRPSFELKLKRPTEAITFGDTVKVKGSANYLIGTPLSNAKAEYKIIRSNHPYFWWWHTPAPEKVVATGVLTTETDGTYTIAFTPEKEGKKDVTACYRYMVKTKVTDANGETHEEEISVAVGDESISFVCPSVGKMPMDKLKKQTFSVVNLNCEGQQKEVKYTVFHNDKKIKEGQTLSDKEKGFSLDCDVSKWVSGKYKIEFSTFDERNREVKSTFETVLYRSTDKVPPIQTDFWTEECTSTELAKGESASIRIGSSLPNGHLLEVIYTENGLQSYKWIDLKNQILTFKYDLKDCETKNIQFFLLHDGLLNTKNITLSPKSELKELPMKLSVFRDKMEPGSKENWTISLPAGKAAEVLATMYDASLDQIKSNHWYFSPSYSKYYDFPYWQQCLPAKFFLALENNMSTPRPIENPYGFIPIEVFNSRRMFDMAYSESAMGGKSSYKRQMSLQSKAVPAPEMAEISLAEEAEVADKMEAMPTANDEASGEPVKIRSNFAETAFFYPELTTDSEGNVNLSFTMPESLTRWKFMALAHTPDLYTSQLIKNVVTQKDFMISPNYPRFLRHGDKCTLSAKVINLSDDTQSGSATLQLLDPVSEKVIMEKSCEFSLQPKDNAAVLWDIEVPRDADALLVRVIGRSNNFSDAEQKLLPVLADRVVLTQSLPIAVRGGQTKEFTLQNLKNNQSTTLENKFLKLEMATNPVWYAVQALPSTANPQHDNAIDLSAALFASKMAEHIAQSNPKIFKVIELWKAQSKDKETLLSNLEKNAEVKNVILNETPWVMDAQNETERKQRLSMLFDVNDIRSKCDNWQKKLNELQNPDGGFCWFKGMLSNRYTTLFVLDNYCRMKKAGIDVANQKESIKRAVEYLDKCLKEDLEDGLRNDKNYKKKAQIWSSQIYYYQLRGQITEINLDKSCKEAYDFYLSLLEKQWDTFSLQCKALAAMALQLNGKESEARKVVKSIREFSETNEEMGMYWPKNVSGYFWEDAAISTHTRLTEALAMVDNKQAEQDELRIWLLNQKRTQNWGSTIATIDALNVLLLNGSDWISKENIITVKMGDNEVKPESTEVGTGYYAITVPGKEVTPSMGSIELKSEAGGNISWGALYWQFEEDMEKVQTNKTGLHIEKIVMLETVEGDKTVLKRLNDKNKVKVGDKLVVRLTLRTDRDLDYVSLKDQRAACLEPTLQLSGYRCSEHTCYYQSAKDAAMYYFFDHLQKGSYVFEYSLYVTNSGDFSNGITTVQCLYAPEFTSNTGSVRIKVGK